VNGRSSVRGESVVPRNIAGQCAVIDARQQRDFKNQPPGLKVRASVFNSVFREPTFMVTTMSDKVLVVDDSGTMRKIIIRALNASGFSETVEAADGNEGLQAFSRDSFKLVMTDWNMPNKNGIELTSEIRATGSTVPIFMVTTEGEKGRVLEAIKAGITDYLVKPFTADVLQEKLGKYVAV
jgi:two-component system chemotaxis response regulator CheY